MNYVPLLICLAATFYLTGLIWVIQLVHYPLFARIGLQEFNFYHNEHSNRIVIALSLPTLLAFVSAVLLVWLHPAAVPGWSIWLNLGLTFGFWVVTGLVQVPLHGRLGQNSSEAEKLIQALVKSNWWRTCIWTAQGLLLVWMMLIALPR